MKRLGCIAFLVGCGFQGSSPSTPIDGNTPAVDAAVPGDTAAPPPIDARQCFGTGLLGSLCLAKAPADAVTLSTPIDTDAIGTCTQVFPQTGSPTAAPELCAIAGKTITVQGAVTVKGSRALVLIGAETVVVMGTLDLSSTTSNPQRVGAGANRGACAAPTAADNDTKGGGGGGGASLATAGGTGGTGDKNVNGVNSSRPGKNAAGGAAGAVQDKPTLLRGGCHGGDGGTADGQHRGTGGNGGGAVYLIAGTSITIPGNVYASGGGGGTTPGGQGAEEGGGGGGTGGMIGLDAPVINIAGRVVANGGGGGGGGGTSGGTPGGDGSTTNWNARAASGNGGGGGANGAPGTALNLIDNLNGGDGDGGAGGGGGGVGIVWIDGAVTGGAMISPAPTAH